MGILYKTNRSTYIGEFSDGKFHGFGRQSFNNQHVNFGNYEQGMRHGIGFEITEDRERNVGIYKDNQKSGLFKVIDKNGNIKFLEYEEEKDEKVLAQKEICEIVDAPIDNP